jgi:hypothetical protein
MLTAYKFWQPQPPAALRSCPGLYRNSFNFPHEFTDIQSQTNVYVVLITQDRGICNVFVTKSYNVTVCTISFPNLEMGSMPLPWVQARKVHPDHTWTY